MFPPRRQPSDDTNQSDNPNGRTGVVHIVIIDGVDGREIESNGSEEQKDESDDIENDTPATERVGPREHFGVPAEARDDADEEGHGV